MAIGVTGSSLNNPNWQNGNGALKPIYAVMAGTIMAAMGLMVAWFIVGATHHHILNRDDLVFIWNHLTSWVSITGASIGGVIGLVFGWLSGGGAKQEIHLRGTELKSVDQLVDKKADGIKVHPKIAITEQQETAHMLLLGGSGSGKTSIVWPILHQIHARGDLMLIFSFKGDFQEKWPDNHFTLLAPWDSRSAIWRMGHDIQTRIEAESLAETLIPTNEKDPIWARGAQGLLTAIIADLQTKHGTEWGAMHLAQSAASMLANYELLLETVMRESPIAKAYLMGKDSKTTASFLAQMASGLSQVIHLGTAEHSARQQTSKPSGWSVLDWLSGKQHKVAIIGFKSTATGVSQAFAASIIEQTVRQILDLPDAAPNARRIWLVVDEAPQAGRVPSITQALEAARSKGCRIVLGIQGTQQIEKAYDRQTRATWAGQTATKIIARLKEPDDQKWASSLLGERELERFQATQNVHMGNFMTSGASNISNSYQRVREHVMLPSQFGTDLDSDYPRGIKAVLMSQKGSGVIDWPFPQINTMRPSIVLADWLKRGYKRPGWGSVPPRLGEPQQNTGMNTDLNAAKTQKTETTQQLVSEEAKQKDSDKPESEEKPSEGIAEEALAEVVGHLIPHADLVMKMAEITDDIFGSGKAGPLPLAQSKTVIQEIDDEQYDDEQFIPDSEL